MAPRGIRNNNPGNIEHGDDWNGLATTQRDARFCTFTEPEFGVRAMCKIFFTYFKREMDNDLTISEILTQWAPPHENPTATYIDNVAKWTGFDKDEALDLKDAEVLAAVAIAIARQENGTAWYTRSVYQEGARRALA